jgi:L-asparaginase/Glu-tRNA(Gln) amidotransferase subunit D
MLNLGGPNLDLEIHTLIVVDSRHMTDEARQIILRRCGKAPEGPIVITHGTDTMARPPANWDVPARARPSC